MRAIVCTHAHNDHINAAAELAEATDAPIRLHPDDTMLWEVVYPDRSVDDGLADGQRHRRRRRRTDGAAHARALTGRGVRCTCREDGIVFSGDTLFNGGPGATGRSFSDRGQLEESIRENLFALPGETGCAPATASPRRSGQSWPRPLTGEDRRRTNPFCAL